MAAILETSHFLMKEGLVFQTLRKIAARLSELDISYAVVGGLALNAHGYVGATTDVAVLVNAESLARIHRELDGLGYLPPSAGSKHLRDVDTQVRIKFLVTGQYPGDGKPQPIGFPNPEEVGVKIDGVRYINLPNPVELELASGMTNRNRLKDLADVQELIKVLKLPAEFADRLNPYVRPGFIELWTGIAEGGEDEA